MRKNLMSIFIWAAIVSFGLSGCGGDTSSTADTPQENPSGGSGPVANEPASDQPAEAGSPVPQSPAPGACNVIRDSYDGTSNWGYLTIGRHYNDAARITVTGNYTVCKLRLKMYQYNAYADETAQHVFDVSIFSHDAVRDAPGQRIGQPSATMSAGSLIRGETNSLGQAQGKYTAIQDVYFELDVPVTPGTYWLVFKTHNYSTIDWRQRLRNHAVPDSSNSYPLRGRALSYSPDPAGLGNGGWEEFYTCQVRYALYSN